MLALINGHEDIVRILSSAGADVDKQDTVSGLSIP